MQLGGDDLHWVGATLGACLSAAACGGGPSSASPDAGGSPIDAPAGEGAPDAVTENSTPWTSGARLRAKVLNGGEGAQLFVEWQDTVLRLPCSFTTAIDGRLRCLPIDEDTATITTNYADAQCTMTIALGPAPQNPYVRIRNRRCGRAEDDVGAHRVVRWGSTLNVDVPYVLRDGVCVPISNGPVLTWHSIGEVPPGQFVAATAQVQATPNGAQPQIVVAEDGARENARLIDPSSSQPCEVLADHVLDAPDLCVPLPFAIAPALSFSDEPACDKILAFAEPECSPALTGVALRSQGCVTPLDVVELGPYLGTLSTGLFRRGRDGVCHSDQLLTPMAAYAALRPFSSTTFAVVENRLFGAGRLRAPLRTTSDGVAVRNARLLPIKDLLDPDNPLSPVQPAQFEFYDSIRQGRCRVESVVDASKRCLPTSTQPKLGHYFEDSTCAQPVQLGSNDPSCPSTGFASLPGWEEIGLALPPTTEIRPILGLLQTTPYTYAPDPGGDPTRPPRGTCILDTPDQNRVFYSLGDPIGVADLPLVVETIE